MARFLARVLSAAAAIAWGAPASAAPPSAPLMSVLLRPGHMDELRGTGSLKVVLTVSDMRVDAGAPLLSLPKVIANTATVAETLTELKATDALGEVPLVVRDDPAGGPSPQRHWTVGRPVSGRVVVSYRAPIDDTPPKRGSGPPYGLRTEGGGFSAVGNTFILLPDQATSYRIALRWDLDALPKGSTATSSYGEGDVTLEPGPAARLASTIFMAGPMRREPRAVVNDGFSSAWLGQPTFDPRPLMEWTGRLHGWISGFFQDRTVPPYRVFLRYNPINAGGGAAMTRSFLATYGTGVTPDSLKGVLSHEMVHTWTEADAGQWYIEGVAVHYQALLPFRGGLFSADDFLKDLNGTARRYYSNALNRTPDAEIAPRFWEDTRIRVLPYDRGAMYLAVLDGRIRRASGGRRSLDDLVREMNRRRAAGLPTDDAAWVRLVTGELGEDGRKLHEAMMAGALMLPEPGDFGPCFTRTTGAVRRFELGFDPKSLVGGIKTIRGLQAGSEAAKAGLKDGDVVTYAVALDIVQSEPERRLTLQVTRDGTTFPITYLPRGENVEVYQWKRVSGVDAALCRG